MPLIPVPQECSARGRRPLEVHVHARQPQPSAHPFKECGRSEEEFMVWNFLKPDAALAWGTLLVQTQEVEFALKFFFFIILKGASLETSRRRVCSHCSWPACRFRFRALIDMLRLAWSHARGKKVLMSLVPFELSFVFKMIPQSYLKSRITAKSLWSGFISKKSIVQKVSEKLHKWASSTHFCKWQLLGAFFWVQTSQ